MVLTKEERALLLALINEASKHESDVNKKLLVSIAAKLGAHSDE